MWAGHTGIYDNEVSHQYGVVSSKELRSRASCLPARMDPTIGEELQCAREDSNDKDPYAVAVMKEHDVVGHVPRRISAACSLFLRAAALIGKWHFFFLDVLPQGHDRW